MRWSRRKPEAAVRLEAVRSALGELSQRVSVPTENLLTPDVVRRLIWDWQQGDDTRNRIDAFLTEAGARPWQRALTVPVLANALTEPVETASDQQVGVGRSAVGVHGEDPRD